MHSQFEEIARSIIEPIRNQRGCQGCNILKHIDEPEMFNFTEKWESIASFQTHLYSKHFRKLLFAMDLSSAAPKIMFQDFIGDHKMDSIEHMFEFAESYDRQNDKLNV